MKWMNKLERKFGKYAIPNLMYYIIILYALGFVLNMIAPGFYQNYLSLNIQNLFPNWFADVSVLLHQFSGRHINLYFFEFTSLDMLHCRTGCKI